MNFSEVDFNVSDIRRLYLRKLEPNPERFLRVVQICIRYSTYYKAILAVSAAPLAHSLPLPLSLLYNVLIMLYNIALNIDCTIYCLFLKSQEFKLILCVHIVIFGLFTAPLAVINVLRKGH